jgi:HlyD family secretion protein
VQVKALVTARQAQVREASGNLMVAWSRVGHAEAQVRRSQAALRQAEADLERTVIRAPADGIVIDRSVSAGQTVAASFQAPSLFTIGDLRTVAAEVAIDEADIGRVRSGQSATFSVDAFPGKVFAGSITQVRKAPHTQETVVTYTVVLSADNPDLLLFPGMTAKAEIVTDQNPDALQVPTAALRYRPEGIPKPPDRTSGSLTAGASDRSWCGWVSARPTRPKWPEFWRRDKPWCLLMLGTATPAHRAWRGDRLA